jgi:hypothetical protein
MHSRTFEAKRKNRMGGAAALLSGVRSRGNSSLASRLRAAESTAILAV